MENKFKPFSLNLHGRLFNFTRPAVMGIVNVTPDSFFAGSRTQTAAAIATRVEQMLAHGVDIIDIGACSSRPGATPVRADEETERLRQAVPVIRSLAPHIPLSVDTYNSSTAIVAIEELGCDIINDISGCSVDPKMHDTVARLKAPYILTHLSGTLSTMESKRDTATTADIDSYTASVIAEMSGLYNTLRIKGVCDIIIDPGFGFGKTIEQNYRLLRDLPALAEAFNAPLLAGISRKSMLTRPLGIDATEALNATTAANVIALAGGASILRVHDVKEARQAIDILQFTTCHN